MNAKDNAVKICSRMAEHNALRLADNRRWYLSEDIQQLTMAVVRRGRK